MPRGFGYRSVNISSCDCEGHYVLKLVAKSVGAAQLVKCRARPNAAPQRLIEQPSIHESVHGRFGCGDLDGAEDVVPAILDLSQRGIEVRSPIACQNLTGPLRVFRLAQKEHNLGAGSRLQLKRRLKRGTRIEPRSCLSGKSAASLERQRTFERPIAPDKFSAISGAGILCAS